LIIALLQKSPKVQVQAFKLMTASSRKAVKSTMLQHRCNTHQK